MRTIGSQNVVEKLEGISAALQDPTQMLDKTAVLSCGGIYLRRGRVDEKLRNWKVIVNLPHEEGARTYQINRQTTESIFHLIIRKENLN
ncbi:MAG: hypothetical protein Q7S00_04075 [bacterium]|nr:hypothetical protein [bacterium]